MSIRFRTRKDHRSIDASFYLANGKTSAPLDSFLIGDSVHILFKIEEEMESAIRRSEIEELRAFNGCVHIPCKVVDRSHSMSWSRVGEFQTLGMSMCMEAASGPWEDVLLWVVMGERPTWAEK